MYGLKCISQQQMDFYDIWTFTQEKKKVRKGRKEKGRNRVT